MTKRVMTKIISNIQFIIYSFFAFVLSMLIIAFASLSYGIHLPLIILPHFKAEQLYIKLDKKLILEAKSITVTLGNDGLQEMPILEIPKITPILDFVRTNFTKVNIQNLHLNNNIVTFSYNEKPKHAKDNSMGFKGKGIDTLILFNMYEDYVALDVDHFRHEETHIEILGKSIYNLKTELSSTQLKLLLPDCAELDIFIKEDTRQLAFTASSNSFTDLAPIIKLFDFSPALSKWIVQYNTASSYKLITAKGLHNYRNADLILDTLYLEAKEKDVHYTFNEKLSPVRAKEVDIYFTKGILDVQPRNAFYNNHPIKAGVITIDFNDEHVLLELDLKVNTRVSHDIVDIVEAYDIPLPLVQTVGKTEGHVRLHIDLFTEEAYANAQFLIKDSQVQLAGVPYRIKNTIIRLNKSFLSVDSGEVFYKNIFRAKVNGSIELKELVGDFYFNTSYINFPLSEKYSIKLTEPTQFNLKYTKEEEKILFNNSKWHINTQNINLQQGSISFLEKFSPVLRLENLHLKTENLTEAKLRGEIDLSKDYLNIEADLYKLSHQSKDLRFSSADTIKLKYIFDENITHVKLLNKSTITLNEHNISIRPTRLRIKNDMLDIHGARLTFDKNISTKLSVHHKLSSKKADLSFENTSLFSEELLFIGPKVKVRYSSKADTHHFNAKSLELHMRVDKNQKTSIKVKDIRKLYPYSPLLQMYSIKEGDAELSYKDKVLDIDFSIDNFIPLLSKNGKDITHYHMRGQYKKDVLHMKINDEISLRYKTKVKARINNIDIKLHPLLDYINSRGNKDKKSDIEYYFKAKNTNILLGAEGRSVLADNIEIYIHQDTLDAKLFYKDGGVLFQSKGEDFTIFGNGLDDKFMNALFKFSTVEHGVLSFNTYGNFDNYTTLMNIDNTIIKDYTILNNTLAFFNTIPALVTFSVPGYSKSGLRVSNAYASFDINNSIMHIKDSKMTSKELVITLEGEGNLDEETIDVRMQVKTDIGSSAKNIPLVGYIIFGDETISTTVHIHGPMKDPEVDNSAAKSVVAAPYNIIKRTITLPFKWFNDIFFKEEEEEKKK